MKDLIKNLKDSTILVTGGAGFIGSSLVDALMKYDAEVCVIDNLSSGNLNNLSSWIGKSNFTFFKYDLLDNGNIRKAISGSEHVFHLAADPGVRMSSVTPRIPFEQNILATQQLLETIRKTETVRTIVFTSSSTIYGETSKIPTPEDFAPIEPISIYGASKAASEALVSAFSHTYGFKAVIFRLANIVGPRSTHGVIYDFIKKLRRNPRKLEILGDGTQKKSYLYVTDCIEGILTGFKKAPKHVEFYNIGSKDWINVMKIAEIVVEEMGLVNVSYSLSEEGKDGRGWRGDVKYMLLSIDKMKSLGWIPRRNSVQAVRETTKEMIRLMNY